MLNVPLNQDDARGAEEIWVKILDVWKERPQDKKRHTPEGQFQPSQSPY